MTYSDEFDDLFPAQPAKPDTPSEVPAEMTDDEKMAWWEAHNYTWPHPLAAKPDATSEQTDEPQFTLTINPDLLAQAGVYNTDSVNWHIDWFTWRKQTTQGTAVGAIPHGFWRYFDTAIVPTEEQELLDEALPYTYEVKWENGSPVTEQDWQRIASELQSPAEVEPTATTLADVAITTDDAVGDDRVVGVEEAVGDTPDDVEGPER